MKTLALALLTLSLAACGGDAPSGSSATPAETADHTHDDGTVHTHDPAGTAATGILPKRLVPATAVSPSFLQLATNVPVIPDIREAVESVGVLTHEGIFGPLLFAEGMRSFFIQLKPGMYLEEHPHPTESLVYTVSGSWVLCSEGKRQVMEPGSIFHFGDGMPTGWEAPFSEDALLLVVKIREEGSDYEPYVQGLRDMASDLETQRADGTEFYFHELEPNHEAIQFARSVNANFDDVLKLRY